MGEDEGILSPSAPQPAGSQIVREVSAAAVSEPPATNLQQPTTPRPHRLNPHLLAYLINPAAFVTILVLRSYGLVAREPVWAYVAVFVLIPAASLLADLLWRSRPSALRTQARLAVHVAAVTIVIYMTGWGPAVTGAYAFVALENISHSGSKIWRAATGWSLVGIAVGQLAIWNGWAPSLLSVHRAATVAVIGSFMLVFLNWMAGAMGAHKERAEIVARASEDRFRSLVQHSTDTTLVIGPGATITYASPAVESLVGRPPEEVLGLRATELLHPEERQLVEAELTSRLQSASVTEPIQFRMAHVDGTFRYAEAVVADLRESPSVGGYVANLRDITERKQAEALLAHRALHDPLTGLANRMLFTDRIEHALARQRRDGKRLAVLLVDLDDFKSVNDSLGHEVGDRLLTAVAAMLTSSVRTSDTVARLGGDEFAILLEDPIEEVGPEEVAERIVSLFGDPIVIEDRTFGVSASVGVSESGPKTSSADELVRNADMAMYSAKTRGKGRWVRFEPPMHTAVQKRLELKTDLLEALSEGDQMELYYQPIVNLLTRELISVEALLRWNRPRYGLEGPLEFLSVAEDSGLIVGLGRWVLRQAVTQLAAWRLRNPSLNMLAMNVNVSGRQLEDPRFVDDVRDALDLSGIDPELLVLEITESILMHETKETILRLSRLKRLGVRLAIDDFGTGYSSLGYLQHFPVDILKVDRSFVAAVDEESRQGALAKAVVGMGEILELQTIAEGVESEEQALELVNLGCVYGQGYLYTAPIPASECEQLLREMAGRYRGPQRDWTGRQLSDFRVEACKGTLLFHRDASVSCSDGACVTSRSAEKALGSHASVMSCHLPACLSCEGSMVEAL